jgi:mycofactocin system creatininase family protein
MHLAELTWPELRDRTPVLVVPLGSVEQHGPHLPLDTDTRIAVAVAERLAAARRRLLVAPPFAYGASGEHAGFPGTLSIGVPGLETAVLELIRSADHFAGVVLLSGHGGNNATLRRVAARSVAEGRRVLFTSCRVAGGDAHAGRVETSVLLHLSPEVVRTAAVEVGELRPWSELEADILAGGLASVTANGILGDPTGATADAGRAYLEEMVRTAGADLDAWMTTFAT